MSTYRRDEHLGHEVPLVGRDDISDKAITLDKLSDDLRQAIEKHDVYRFFDGFTDDAEVLHFATEKPEAILFHTQEKMFVALKDGKYYCQWNGSEKYNGEIGKHIFICKGNRYLWNGEGLIQEEEVSGYVTKEGFVDELFKNVRQIVTAVDIEDDDIRVFTQTKEKNERNTLTKIASNEDITSMMEGVLN